MHKTPVKRDSGLNDYSLLGKSPSQGKVGSSRGKSVQRLPKPPLALPYQSDLQTRSLAKLESVAEYNNESTKSGAHSVQGYGRQRPAPNGYKSF